MALADNIRLYDIATRQQAYVENVKVWQASQFDKFLMKLAEELRDLLPAIRHDNLDALTKVELIKFLRALRDTQSRLYSVFLQDVTEQLEDFMKVSLTVSAEIWANADGPVDDVEAKLKEADNTYLFGLAAVLGTGGGMWATIKNAPMPANGQLMLPFIKGFTNSAQAAVENAVRKAYANGESLKQLTDSILKRSPQGTGGILQRIGQNGKAVQATAMQHIAQVVSAGITSGLYGRYQWYSVIDSRTTQICLQRNGKIYIYGKGPIPPAHILCRSHIAPYRGSGDVPDETFNAWFGRQSQDFRDDYSATSPLTFAGYLRKIALILSR